MVPVNKVVVAMAECPATVGAELCCWLAATFLVFLQLIRTAESADVAHLNLLTSFHRSIEGEAWTVNRFGNCEGRCVLLIPSVSRGSGLGMCLRFRTGLWFGFL